MKKWMFVCLILVLGAMQVQGAIVHRYGMDDPNDSVGTADAVLVRGIANSTSGFTDGQLFLGNPSGLYSNNDTGAIDYLDLPNGIISALGTRMTIETWTTWKAGGMWSRIFDLGTSSAGENISSGNGSYIFLTPYASSNFLRCGILYPGVEESRFDAPAQLVANAEQHIVVTYDEVKNAVRMYLNGVEVGTQITGPTPIPVGFTLSGLSDVNNWLGRSQWGDEMYGGNYNEFRIYNHAMTSAEVAASFAAGTEVSIATPISPADLEANVPATPTLTWASGFIPEDYTDKAFRLFLSQNQADVQNGAPAAMVADVTTTSYTVPAGAPLAKDATYYWRVDEKFTIPGNTDPNFAAGVVQSFETEKTVPVLTTSAPFTLVGGTCLLTVNITSASPVTSVQWYNADNTPVVEGGKISIVNTATSSVLKITDATVEDRVEYWCLVANSAGTSQTANLLADIRSGLIHQYSFNDGTANDLVGTAHGTVMGTVLIDGGQAIFDRNTANYIALPAQMVTPLKSFTIMFWMTSGANEWSRVFDFGKSAQDGAGINYFFYAPTGRFAIKDAANEQAVDGTAPVVGGAVTQVVCVYDTDSAATPTMKVYTNGVYRNQRTNCFAMSVVDDIECWLGRSHYTWDPGFKGTIDEFRIYDYPISAPWIEAAYKAGPNVLPTDACFVKNAYDFSGDCKVNLEDFAIFAAEWLKCGLYSCGAGPNI